MEIEEKKIQFIKFILIGAIRVSIIYILYSLLVFIKIYPLFAQTLVFILALIANIFLHSKYVFKNVPKFKEAFPVYFFHYGSFLILNLSTLYIFIEYLNFNPYLSQFICLGIITPLSFLRLFSKFK